MTDQQHPITLSHEQIKKWQDKFFETEPFLQLDDDNNLVVLLNQVYQAGADQELEACVKWVSEYCPYFGDYPLPEDKLRAARRPQPPSLKEQALEVFEALIHGDSSGLDVGVIRRALEQLDD